MIHTGDCLDILPTLDANSVHAVITDPPYGLSFMGKDWDHGIPGVEFWKAAYRVMKPGAFLLSFGGTRTFHRLTCAIEDAGFEIRDCMMWLYGSGFPKSHDVSKAIDREAGAERKLTRPGVVQRNGYGEDWDTGSSESRPRFDEPSTDAAKQWSGWGTALKPAWEPIIVARKPLEGTVAQNVQKWGTGGMYIDGGRIPGQAEKPFGVRKDRTNGSAFPVVANRNDNLEEWEPSSLGRWPANVILDEEAGVMLDGQSGISKSSGGLTKSFSKEIYGKFKAKIRANAGGLGDTGGASRFFYCAKSSKRERGEGNNHPTVKPISLLTYLAKLVCPPGGVILDPFMGSGSMAVAAKNLGFEFVGIEREEKYCEIAKARLGLVAA